MLFRKTYVRALAVVAESHRDGGATSDVLAPLIFQQFETKCDENVLEILLTQLSVSELVSKDKITGHWHCTPLGLFRYEAIKKNQPTLLARTTSPKLKMHA